MPGELEMALQTQDALLNVERQLWTNNAELYRATLLPDAVLVFAETGVIGRDVAVSEIERENAEGRRWAEVDISDVRWLSVGDDVMLLTYRVVARWSTQSAKITALASSLYVKRHEAWKLAFHQQSLIDSKGATDGR